MENHSELRWGLVIQYTNQVTSQDCEVICLELVTDKSDHPANFFSKLGSKIIVFVIRSV